MSSIILRTEKLCKTFSNGGLQQHVLKNMDINIMQGDFTVIMGASGSGKSTLLYALSGMDRPSLGKVYFGEEDISLFSDVYLSRKFWRIENSFNDFKNCKRSGNY